ncbi:MAG: histone H1 [Burkholderiales bacterium]|nr:histone H1 [Phycisphaerae bacterium]
MAKNPKRPRDTNQLAKFIVDVATGNAPAEPESNKNPAAVALGKLGGAKGGKARAAALTPAKRQAIAKKAAAKRWGKP